MDFSGGIENTCQAVVINSKNQVLRVVSPKWNKYIFPGGHVEAGETIFEAVVRESLEELGVLVEPLKLLFFDEQIILPPKFHRPIHMWTWAVLCRLKDDESIKLDNIELTHFKWMTIEDALLNGNPDAYDIGILNNIPRQSSSSCSS